MNKKVYIRENNLINLKRFMTGENASHKPFIVEDEPPYEKDEYVIGGEGGNNDFFHVNESYGYAKTVDFSEIGAVNYNWDFSEEEYQEWLVDEEIQDTPDVKLQYIKDYVTFDVDFLDSETLHTCGNDNSMMYDDLEDVFGERMAERILNDCMEDGFGRFEKYEMYKDDVYDINNPQELNDITMKLLPHGEYYKNCRGFILTNGVVVYTPNEHDEVTIIDGIKGKLHFIKLGNIRVLDNSIDIGSEPTWDQREVLKQVLREYDGEEFYLDIHHNNSEIGVKYPVLNPYYAFGEIERFYSEGIKPQGGSFYENKECITINENTFEKWFGNSILKDENGKPIKMYHGTDKEFDAFSKDYIGSTGAFEGYGFNFSPYYSTAVHYNSKNIIEAYLRVENPMTTKTNKLTLNRIIKIIAELDKGKPFTDTIVAAYEPPNYKENWDEKYYRRALLVAAKAIYDYNIENGYGDAGIYSEICLNGQADAKDVIRVFESLGYDSVIHYNNYNGKIKTVVVFEPNQIKKTSNKTFSTTSDVMSENIEAEVEASEVNLDSFKKRKILVPNIWDGFDLNSRVRIKLLDIADDFWDFCNITWVKRKGIHLTGSICNFNWSKFSDIDLHIVVDFSEIDDRKDFVQEYFNSKKNEWNDEHSNLKIYGFPVELYVEDINAETKTGGLYDLEDNSWIKKPSEDEIKEIGLDKYEIKDKSSKLMTLIDDLYDELNSTDDDAVIRNIGKKSHRLLDRIKRMRNFGLQRGGESDLLNIVYKVLRRSGYMEKLWDINSEFYDKVNSIVIDESINGKEELILEYLESIYNLPLYRYFKWAKTATDEEKAKDLIYQCSYMASKYLETRNANQCNELRELRMALKKGNEEDMIYNEEFVDAFAKGIVNNGLFNDFKFFMSYRENPYELPSWMSMDFNRIVKNEWCIHFCYDADSIAREGFKWGTDDIGRLALTGAGMKKPSEGYNFAFPIGERHIDRNSYGSFNPSTRQKGPQEAVIFQTSGVEVYHGGDEQNQVIFWGPNAKNFIPIKYSIEEGEWCIYGNNGQILYSGNPSKILDWVLTNLPQYRKQIMVGKNGINLNEEVVADGNASHNPFKQRWKHEREVLINYLVNYGEIMTSKENGKQYKVFYDTTLSSRLGINYCICIQWNPITMKPGNIIYVRAYDKFTKRLFKPEFDTRGFDNIQGTQDDVNF